MDSLKLDLKNLTEDRLELEREYEPSQFRPTDEYRVAAPVRFSAVLHRSGNAYRLVGTLRAQLELPCSRCLEGMPFPVDAGFDLRYVPAEQNTGEGEIEVAEDDLSTAYYRDEAIHLGELINEQFYLALPMKPLCRPECRGLCPVCGANWNAGECGCDTSWEDPRLAGLKGAWEQLRKS